MTDYGQIPAELQDRPQWVRWREQRRGGEATKVPFSVGGAAAKSNDPATWATFAEAVRDTRGYAGIGFTFSGDDPYCGIDLDGCRNPPTGEIAPWAQEIIDAAGPTYAEVSPSGSGVKVWVRATWPHANGKKRPVDAPRVSGKTPAVEVYPDRRFFVVTADKLPGAPSEIGDGQKAIDLIVRKYIPLPKRQPSQSNGHHRPAFERARKYAAKYPPAISGQAGHDTAFRLACVLVLEFDLTPDEALEIMLPWNDTCDPPWTEKELRHKVEDADRQPDPTEGRGWRLNSPADAHNDRPTENRSHDATGLPTPGVTEAAGHFTIEVTTAEHVANDAAVKAIGKDPDTFQRGGELVYVIEAEDPATKARRPIIRPMPLAIVRDRLSRHIAFQQLKTRGATDTVVPVHPPEWCVKAVAAMGQYPGMRSLAGVIEHPVIRPDGSILKQSGYDAATGMILSGAIKDVSVPDRPTLAERQAAVDVLLDLMADFPFADDGHRSAWLALLLTPLARVAFDGPAPMFVIDANVRGSGKTLAAELVSLILYGKPAPRYSNTRDDDEFRKRITSVAISGGQFVLLDNIVGPLGCASLDAALTSTSWSDRRLGVNELGEWPLTATWVASGNNIQLAADTSRRVVHIRLESPEEKPEERDGFRYPDIRRHVRENRPALLSAALTILRAYHVAGRPDQDLTPWGSFEAWSALVRNSLVWCGLTDPGSTRQELVEVADRDAIVLRELMQAWPAADPQNEGVRLSAMLKTLAQDALSAPLDQLRDAVLEFCPGKGGNLPTATRLGHRLRQVRRRVIGGRCLDSNPDSHAKVAVWCLMSSEDVHPQSPAKPSDLRGMRGIAGDSGTISTRARPHARAQCGAENTPQSPAYPAGDIQHADRHCRSGRWWQHFSGGVYCLDCHPPKGPDAEATIVARGEQEPNQ